MKKKTLRPSLLGASLLACGAVVAPVNAQWSQNGTVGPSDYASAANWTNGVINNQFIGTPASGLNITFGADYTFSSQVTMGWGSNPNVTFRSDSATPRTLKLNGDFVRTNFTGGIVTIGTVANPLVLDLNGATRQIGGAATGGAGNVSSTNYIYAQITDSSGGNHGVNLSRGLTYCYLLNGNNNFSGPVSFTGYRGGGFSSIKNIWGGPSALGAPTDAANATITIADQKSFGELTYLGAGDTSDRPFQWNLGASSYVFANRGTGKLTLTGPWNLTNTLTINAASNHIELDGYIQGSSGGANMLKIQGGSAKQVLLTCPSNTFQAVEVDSGVLAYNNIADAGVPCALGTGPNVVMAAGTLQWVGPSATNNRPLLFTNAGPYNVENATADATLTLAADFTWGITDAKTRTINLNVGNFSTLAVSGLIGDLVNPTTITVGAAAGITLLNGGTVQLLNPANSFSGGVQVKYGRTLQVSSLANAGLPCSLGVGPSLWSGQSGIILGSTDSQRGGALAYIGTTDAACDRAIGVLGSGGGQASATVLNNSSNNSSLHLSNPNPWVFDMMVMSNCSVVLGGTAMATNVLDAIIPNTALGNARLTVSGSTWVLTAAQQYLGTTTVTNGTLLLQSYASITSGGGVTVQGGGTLGGTGTIYENVTVQADGRVSPGLGDVGSLTIYGNLTNNGSLVMKLNKAGNTADQIVGLNTLVYGGTLVVTNLAGTLADGDSFQLFQASSYVGSFGAVSPGTPGPGLAWDLSRLNTGVLGVVSSTGPISPQVTQFRIVPGGTMVISSSGDSGNAFRTGYLLMSTNLTDWTRIRTNTFDASGAFSLTNTLNTGSAPRQFFRLEVQ